MFTNGPERMIMLLSAGLIIFHSAGGRYLFPLPSFHQLMCIFIHSNGRYGLYLENTLLDGSSASCPTFENEPLCSAGLKKAGNVSFECVGLEVWAVGPS